MAVSTITGFRLLAAVLGLAAAGFLAAVVPLTLAAAFAGLLTGLALDFFLGDKISCCSSDFRFYDS